MVAAVMMGLWWFGARESFDSRRWYLMEGLRGRGMHMAQRILRRRLLKIWLPVPSRIRSGYMLSLTGLYPAASRSRSGYGTRGMRGMRVSRHLQESNQSAMHTHRSVGCTPRGLIRHECVLRVPCPFSYNRFLKPLQRENKAAWGSNIPFTNTSAFVMSPRLPVGLPAVRCPASIYL